MEKRRKGEGETSKTSGESCFERGKEKGGERDGGKRKGVKRCDGGEK